MKISEIVVLILGIGLITTVFFASSKNANPSNSQFWVYRVMLALGGACIASIIPGFVTIESQMKELVIRAGGAIAIFILLYLINPPANATFREFLKSKK